MANRTVTLPAGCEAVDRADLFDDEEQDATKKGREAEQNQARPNNRNLFFVILYIPSELKTYDGGR